VLSAYFGAYALLLLPAGELVDRFGARHPDAVATIVTASRAPVRLDELIADYERIGPELRAGGPRCTKE